MTDTQLFQQARQARDSRFDGVFFVAVKSTGIFCRPICPAPAPKEQNVEYFSLAPLAIQAGYRPCLRCRPDSAPGSYAWKGVDTTVERAVTLLTSFPELTVIQICEKLGVSDRYLRDLFIRKLGIAPKKFRLYDQLLFAKNLLHNSGLNIEQVAQASGFSSARRLQDNLKTSLQLTPSQIRKSDNSDLTRIKPTNLQRLSIRLAFRQPYHWPHLRDFLAIRAIPGVEEVTQGSYAKNFSLEGVQGHFTAIFEAQKNSFLVELQISDLRQIKAVVYHIRRVLDLDCDPDLIRQGLLQAGIKPEDLLEGIRLPGVWSPFEAGCRAILGQQISVKAAINLVSLLVQKLGIQADSLLYFPSPQAVAESDLNFLKMPDKRRQTLRDFARYQIDNHEQSDLSQWLRIKGVGPWTVAYAQMRGQSQPDIWLNTDLVVKKQIVKNALNDEQAAPWRSYLTFQLWSMA
ncbi:AlkA N-terminal domain-containing protein [Aliiglaciecola sp. LCG003]|uniref:DNA-3-methyladenine glycosylase 2 family protein n=1 Tax=Aliiglaciecola sp. LCG003 TaxID=3053655 RepID=UPI002573E036|nr:AlkA N-terminal domain-containing protein [Aliiglaciecola sp. LCG003]WJG09225.1 AlkA N-terminal domain-containing protein [Aliiglaciecola sp. LCG003]